MCQRNMTPVLRDMPKEQRGSQLINVYFSFSEDQNINTQAKPNKQKDLDQIPRSLSANCLLDIWAHLFADYDKSPYMSLSVRNRDKSLVSNPRRKYQQEGSGHEYQ